MTFLHKTIRALAAFFAVTSVPYLSRAVRYHWWPLLGGGPLQSILFKRVLKRCYYLSLAGLDEQWRCRLTHCAALQIP